LQFSRVLKVKMAMKRFTAALIALLAARLMGAPPPQLIREIDLNQIVPVRPGYMPITTYAFSPDEKWLAITLAVRPVDPRDLQRNSGQPGSDRVLLVPVSGPAELRMQIDPGLSPLGNPGWSPNSDAFFVRGFAENPGNPLKDGILKLWNLQGAELLNRDGPGGSLLNIYAHLVLYGLQPQAAVLGAYMGGVFGFLDPDHLLAHRLPAKGTPAALETVDLHGQVVDTWTVPKDWTIVDISPDGRRLAVVPEFKTLVVDYPSMKVVLKKDSQYTGASFTEGGRTLCSVGSATIGPDPLATYTQCWDVDTGKKIAQFGDFLGGAPAAASSHGSRLVLTHTALLPKRTTALVYFQAERVVWDFRSGTEVAAWIAPQTSPLGSMHGIRYYPAPVAISSNGRYVAEAEGALLRIYELP
jgi:hypothetical protein